jgi:hypothetical protein
MRSRGMPTARGSNFSRVCPLSASLVSLSLPAHGCWHELLQHSRSHIVPRARHTRAKMATSMRDEFDSAKRQQTHVRAELDMDKAHALFKSVLPALRRTMGKSNAWTPEEKMELLLEHWLKDHGGHTPHLPNRSRADAGDRQAVLEKKSS